MNKERSAIWGLVPTGDLRSHKNAGQPSHDTHPLFARTNRRASDKVIPIPSLRATHGGTT